MRPRPLSQVGNFTVGTGVGPALDNQSFTAMTTDANMNISATAVLAGIIYRSGLTAGRTDTFPSADAIIAALDNPQVNDSWPLTIRVNEAFALTLTAGAGFVVGVGTTTGVAASSTRHFRFTLLSTKRTTIKIATTTNTDPNLTKVPLADLKDVMPGMSATGTGVGASAVVIGISEYIDATTGERLGKITLSVNSTATADLIAVTFAPRIRIDSFGVHGN